MALNVLSDLTIAPDLRHAYNTTSIVWCGNEKRRSS